MVADEDQMRFYRRPRTPDEAHAWLERNLVLYERRGFGFWLVESRAERAFLGYCGIRPLVLDDQSTTEIGWHTRKTAWNRGVATEAAASVRDLAFTRFEQTQLVALVPPDHAASRRVAEKIGMQPAEVVVVDGDAYVTYTASPFIARSSAAARKAK